jgi:hypothetical protein
MIANNTSNPQTLAQLRYVRGDLLCARMIALQLDLSVTRSHELVAKISDALTLVGQLIKGDNP